MLSLTPLSRGNCSERNTILCRLSVESTVSQGEVHSAFFLFSPPLPLHLFRGSSAGLSLRGGAVKRIWRTQGSNALALLTPRPPFWADRVPTATEMQPFSWSCVPGTLGSLSSMHHQYFIIGLLCSPVHAWVSLEIKLYCHLQECCSCQCWRGEIARPVIKWCEQRAWCWEQERFCWGWWEVRLSCTHPT